MKQVFEKIKVNSKYVNSYFYFTKDYLFFYFSCKKLKNNQNLISDSLSNIKNEFLLKFKEALIDNFSRAFKLVETINNSAQMGIEFEKESGVNFHIVEHLVDYIKKISQSFTDLYIQFAFTNDDYNFYSNKDQLIIEMQDIFEEEINNNYFIPINNNIEKLFKLLENPEINANQSKLYIQLIYFNNFILYKMNDIFYAFINSNISYLIKNSLVICNQAKIINNNSKLFKKFKDSLPIKAFLNNLNNKEYCINMIKELVNKTNLYFGEINHFNNIFYEQNLIENCLYSYFICCIFILCVQGTFDGEYIDQILDDLINNISKEIIKINHSDLIIKFHEFIKLLSCIENEDKLNEYTVIIGKSKIKKFLFNIKKAYYNHQKVLTFLANKKMEETKFLHILVIMIMNLLKCNSEQEIDFYNGEKNIVIECMKEIENEFFK
jgi:hypothetical protein